ncbi:MAG: T9SS type A sorting domain-containing protein, partial [Bacteroidota bacterium]
ACYCIPPAQTCSGGDEIDQVVMGSVLTNTSACSFLGYSDYTSSVTTATVNASSAYSMSVTVGSDYNEDVTVWIDYDHSGTFDASEYTYIGSPSGSGNYVVTNTVTISPTASLGLTRMRVRNTGKGQSLSASDACITPTGGGARLNTSSAYGETEDYSVYILPPNCSGNNLPPNLTVASSAATVCPNGAITLTVTGTIPNYTGLTYQWQSSPTGSGYNNVGSVVPNPSITVNPTQSNYYICNILCNGSPAINTSTVYVSVNVPTINATANNYTICPAEPTTLQATGAVSYTWTNNGALTASTVVTPTINTTYTVTGTGVNGCTASNTVALVVKPATGITGTITTGASIPVPGTAILYKYEPFFTKFDSVTSQAIAGNGGYNFPSVNYGIYIIKAVPTASTLQVTYGLNSINWKTATTITHACATADVQNISVVSLTSLPLGPGALSGRITEGVGFGQRPSSVYSPLAPGSPIGGIVVKGGKNPGGNMFSQTTTNSNGTYSLTGLPNNNPGEEYFILVDIPGLDTNNTYHRVITSVNNVFTNLDFVVDSAKINPVQNSVGIKSLSVIENQIKVYPNPANGKVSVLYTLPANSAVSIELYDILGQAVKTILPLTEQSTGEHRYTASLSDLTAGMYFVKLKINNAETSVKLFVTN